MVFDICLPRSRIETSRGLWADRLPIDDLDRAVGGYPNRTAFVGVNSARGEETRLSYAELAARVDKIAAGLLEVGIGKGDVVAFQLPNWWEFTALFYACNRIGAVANPLMPIFRQRELRFMLPGGTWKEYLDKTFIEPFAKANNVEIVYKLGLANDQMVEMALTRAAENGARVVRRGAGWVAETEKLSVESLKMHFERLNRS